MEKVSGMPIAKICTTGQIKERQLLQEEKDQRHFYWQGKYFMIVDAWKGMEVYSSDDLLELEKTSNQEF